MPRMWQLSLLTCCMLSCSQTVWISLDLKYCKAPHPVQPPGDKFEHRTLLHCLWLSCFFFFLKSSGALIIGPSRKKMKNVEKLILSMVLKSINQHFDFPVLFYIATLFPSVFLQELPQCYTWLPLPSRFPGIEYFKKNLFCDCARKFCQCLDYRPL